MSAFNQTRYNLGRYNINAGTMQWLESDVFVTFGFSFAGTTLYAKGNAAVRIHGELELDPGRFAEGVTAAAFVNQSYINGYIWLTKTGSLTFTPELNLSQEAYIEGDALSELDAELNLSQEAYAEGDALSELDAELNLSQEAYVEGDAGEVFMQTADVISLSETICAFPDLVLKPGQTLIIDAGSYNVLLDGQNAIHLQQGDWLDDLSRRTQQIVISGTGVSRLQAQILYIERYL